MAGREEKAVSAKHMKEEYGAPAENRDHCRAKRLGKDHIRS